MEGLWLTLVVHVTFPQTAHGYTRTTAKNLLVLRTDSMLSNWWLPKVNKKCSGTEEKQNLHIITTRFHGLSSLLEERNLSPGSLYTTGDMQILASTPPPYPHTKWLALWIQEFP